MGELAALPGCSGTSSSSGGAVWGGRGAGSRGASVQLSAASRQEGDCGMGLRGAQLPLSCREAALSGTPLPPLPPGPWGRPWLLAAGRDGVVLSLSASVFLETI